MKYAVLLVSVLAFAGCEVNLNSEGVVSRETKRFTVTGTSEIDLNTFEGSIEIHSWDRDEIEVEIEKRAMEQRLVDEMKVTAEQQGNKVIVRVEQPRGEESFEGVQIGVHFSPSARLRVAVPRLTQVSATSGDGSITIEDVSGKIALRTNDGSVRGSRLGGEIFVRSGDGQIRLERAEGIFDLETDDGSITLEGKPSVLRARTSDGAIRLEVQADAVATEDWDLQTADGSVVLTLPSEFDAVIDAETRDGVVRTEHPALHASDGQPGDADRAERRRTLRATLGDGGKTVRVRTGDGTIRIE
jgi:DUF4097 and DUF4098 domain-containing protein YvlB